MKNRFLIGTALASALFASAPAGAQGLFAPVEAGADVATGAVRTGGSIATGAVETGLGIATAPFALLGGGTSEVSLHDFRAEALRNDAYEIESGRLALQRSRDPRVRALARRTIHDRQQTTAALLPEGASLTATGDVVGDRGDGSPFGLITAPITAPVNFAGRLLSGEGFVDNDPGAQGRRVALDASRQQALSTLSGTRGRSFDATYSVQQVASNRKGVALYNGYAQNGLDATGRTFAQEALPNRQRQLAASQRVASQYVEDEPAF